MAAGPFIVVDTALEAIFKHTVDVEGDTFVAVLIAATHTADPSDETWADISVHEASGSGYTSGGEDITPLAVSLAGGVVTVDCANDPLWTPATVSAKFVYVVRKAGGSLVSGDLILGYMDLNIGGGNLSAVGSDFTVEWPADGLFTVGRVEA